MTDTKNGGPAYPCTTYKELTEAHGGHPCYVEVVNCGLTKHEWYAGMALMGLLAGAEQEYCSDEMTPEEVEAWRLSVRKRDANWCFQMADAMLARSQEGDG